MSQLFVILGLTLDLVGFCLIAAEWYKTFDQNALNFQFDRMEDKGAIASYRELLSDLSPDGVETIDWLCISKAGDTKYERLMLKMFVQNEQIADRAKLFKPGIVLVVLGFASQILGTLLS